MKYERAQDGVDAGGGIFDEDEVVSINDADELREVRRGRASQWDSSYAD